MSLVAEFRIFDPDFPLAHTIRTVEDLELTSVFQPGTDIEAPVKYYAVETPDFEAFEAALAADPSVAEVTVTSSTATRRVYQLHHSPDTRLVTPGLLDRGLRITNLALQEGTWRFRVLGPDRATVVDGIEYCQQAAAEFTLERLFGPVDPDPDADFSNEALDTLTVAYSEGYFDVPRGISQAELAEMLGISSSAVSERIRSGTRQLLEGVLHLGEEV